MDVLSKVSCFEIDIRITLFVDFSPGKYRQKIIFLEIKILFTESVLSYNIPQGMVRGATLELLDISYDGVEDPNTGITSILVKTGCFTLCYIRLPHWGTGPTGGWEIWC